MKIGKNSMKILIVLVSLFFLLGCSKQVLTKDGLEILHDKDIKAKKKEFENKRSLFLEEVALCIGLDKTVVKYWGKRKTADAIKGYESYIDTTSVKNPQQISEVYLTLGKLWYELESHSYEEQIKRYQVNLRKEGNLKKSQSVKPTKDYAKSLDYFNDAISFKHKRHKVWISTALIQLLDSTEQLVSLQPVKLGYGFSF